MSTTQFNSVVNMATDADFRNWGSSLSNALAAMGMVKTSDTGQINFTTVTKPGSAGAVVGYEIWRFNDTLQATHPIFFKLEYGAASLNSAWPSLWLTVGTGSDGVGNLTGQVGQRRQFSGAAGGVPSPCYVSGATDRIGVACFPALSSAGFQFQIERTKDSAGANSNVGICTYTSGCGTSMGSDQTIPFMGIIPPADTQPYAFAANSPNAIAGSDIGLFPHYPFWGKLRDPKLNILTYMHLDLQVLVPVQVTMYGTARVYLPLGLNVFYGSGAYQPGRGGGGGSSALMMRWE